jgi:hypothetical protein
VNDSAISPYPTAAEPSAVLIPGWLTWYSPGARQWHARKQGSGQTVHDNTVEELRERTGLAR